MKNYSVVYFSEISGSQGGKYEDDSLLGYSTLMMEAVCTSETLLYVNKTTRCYIQESCHLCLLILIFMILDSRWMTKYSELNVSKHSPNFVFLTSLLM
jgi:hypothetical protein